VGGLDGVVTSFTPGMLPNGSYTMQVTATGSASTLGGSINTSATVTGSTAIDDPVNGLWTTTAGVGTIDDYAGPLSAAHFNSHGFGTGGTLNPANNTPGTLVGGRYWLEQAAPDAPNVSAETFRLEDCYHPGTWTPLTNTGGVLTDAASGFRLDISGITGPVTGGAVITLNFNQDRGVDVLDNNGLAVTDASGTTHVLTLTAGETFQQVADAVNLQATTGGALVHATVGANGLLITNSGASPDSATQIQVQGPLNVLVGLGFAAPIALSTSGGSNPNNTHGVVNGTGGAADTFSGTLTNNVTHAVYNLTNSGNVLSDTNALGFSIDLSAVTGGSLHTGSATLVSAGATRVGVETSSPRTLRLTDETGASLLFTLNAGYPFQILMDAINNCGLAIHAALGSNGLALINTGTDAAASISAQGSDDVLRGLGLEASDGNAASTSNSTTITGTLGTAGGGGGGGGGTSTIITGVGAGSGAAVFQVGANAGDTLSVTFGNATTSAYAGFDTAVMNLAGATADAAHWAGGQQSSTASLLTASDAAITTLNGIASSLGAVQNRLSHTISAVGVASENLAASESRIRDLDVASEMVNFTKTQILQQAGIAILSQANSAPQSILALLR
jgi:hypothetical protein